jgi:hypothetical protein
MESNVNVERRRAVDPGHVAVVIAACRSSSWCMHASFQAPPAHVHNDVRRLVDVLDEVGAKADGLYRGARRMRAQL